MKRSMVMVRLRDDDKEKLKRLAEYYDVSEADVIKILLREYMKNHNMEIQS